jgi:hypothetical protein
MARYRITRAEICEVIGMNQNQFSDYINELRPLQPWVMHNIGFAINTLVGLEIFRTDMKLGVVAPPTPQGGGGTLAEARQEIALNVSREQNWSRKKLVGGETPVKN